MHEGDQTYLLFRSEQMRLSERLSRIPASRDFAVPARGSMAFSRLHDILASER